MFVFFRKFNFFQIIYIIKLYIFYMYLLKKRKEVPSED